MKGFEERDPLVWTDSMAAQMDFEEKLLIWFEEKVDRDMTFEKLEIKANKLFGRIEYWKIRTIDRKSQTVPEDWMKRFYDRNPKVKTKIEDMERLKRNKANGSERTSCGKFVRFVCDVCPYLLFALLWMTIGIRAFWSTRSSLNYSMILISLILVLRPAFH